MSNKDKIIEILKNCFDPEIPIDLWNLGLIYNIDIKDDTVHILMTLTTPGCSMADMMAEDIKQKVLSLNTVNKVKVTTTFDPVWTPDMMTNYAREKLGFNVTKNETKKDWE